MTQFLYLMRHGETLFNQLHKIQGWCDSPLTEKGIRQAQLAGRYFKEQGIAFDTAYASTSERACDTLELVTDLPYQRVKGLKEWHFGRFEGEPEFLNPPLPYRDFFVAYGGEGMSALQQRMKETIQQLMDQSGESVLMVSHGGAIRNFLRVWEHRSEIVVAEPLRNCGFLKFRVDEAGFELVELVNHDFGDL